MRFYSKVGLTKKFCRYCKTLKDSSEFDEQEETPTGLAKKCNLCISDKEDLDREKDRLRYHVRKLTPEYKKAVVRRNKIYEKNNKEKKRAHSRVFQAVKRGELIKAPCIKCGHKIVHGHHEDYSKPLNVVWLCARHHSEHHKHEATNE